MFRRGVDSVKRFELEIPGVLNWKFTAIDDAVIRTVRLMVNSIQYACIYQLNEEGSRDGILLWLEKSGIPCPFCSDNETVVRISGVHEKYDELSICRKCERSFRDPPTSV